MRIARAVIAPDAATHRVKGRVDRSESRPSRRMGGLSSWRRAFRRLAFQPHGVWADTGVYAVFKEQRRERIISLSYTSRKIGKNRTPRFEKFTDCLQMRFSRFSFPAGVKQGLGKALPNKIPMGQND